MRHSLCLWLLTFVSAAFRGKYTYMQSAETISIAARVQKISLMAITPYFDDAMEVYHRFKVGNAEEAWSAFSKVYHYINDRGKDNILINFVKFCIFRRFVFPRGEDDLEKFLNENWKHVPIKLIAALVSEDFIYSLVYQHDRWADFIFATDHRTDFEDALKVADEHDVLNLLKSGMKYGTL